MSALQKVMTLVLQVYMYAWVHVQSLQPWPTLCDPVDCSPLGSLTWDSPGKKSGMRNHALLQGIFPTQGSNLHLLHCKHILYHWATREADIYLYILLYFGHLLWLRCNLLILLGIKRNKINKKEVPTVLQTIKPVIEQKCDIQSYSLFRNK